MSMSSREESQEFVVSPELAEAAEHLGVALRPGDRVRFEVIEGRKSSDAAIERDREPWPPPWVGAIKTDEGRVGANAREIMRAEIAQS